MQESMRVGLKIKVPSIPSPENTTGNNGQRARGRVAIVNKVLCLSSTRIFPLAPTVSDLENQHLESEVQCSQPWPSDRWLSFHSTMLGNPQWTSPHGPQHCGSMRPLPPQ